MDLPLWVYNAISIGQAVLQLAYPITILIIVNLPSVTAAFAGQRSSPDEPEEPDHHLSERYADEDEA